MATSRIASATPPTANGAQKLYPGRDLALAYGLLVTANLARARLTLEAQRAVASNTSKAAARLRTRAEPSSCIHSRSYRLRGSDDRPGIGSKGAFTSCLI